METLATEHGLLGIISFIALSGMIFMFKKLAESQEARLTDKDKHTDDLLDCLDKQINSNAVVRELIKDVNTDTKDAIIQHLSSIEKGLPSLKCNNNG